MSVYPALIYAILQEDRILKKYGVNELRRMYLEFFESKGQLAMKSFSLVPHKMCIRYMSYVDTIGGGFLVKNGIYRNEFVFR